MAQGRNTFFIIIFIIDNFLLSLLDA